MPLTKRNFWLRLVIASIVFYIFLVALFESLLGYFQPEAGNTVVITTFDNEGQEFRRVVSLLSSDEQLYIAVNHWPRAWYRRVRENSNMRMEREGNDAAYTGVVIGGGEHDRVQADNPTGFMFRFLTGFPPRSFVRLDPE